MDECRREPYKAAFYAGSCGGCPLSELCPTKQYKGDDQRVLRWRDAKAATATRQRQQQQPDFKDRYRIRSGIESTNEEFKSRHGAGDVRVRGQDRLRMTMFLKASALDIKRACQHAVQAVSAPLNATPAEA